MKNIFSRYSFALIALIVLQPCKSSSYSNQDVKKHLRIAAKAAGSILCGYTALMNAIRVHKIDIIPSQISTLKPSRELKNLRTTSLQLALYATVLGAVAAKSAYDDYHKKNA